MKDAKEQHAQESNTDFGGKKYADFFEPIPFPKTFSDRKTNSAGSRQPGYDRSWEDASKRVTPQGDGKTGPRIPVSGGQEGDTPRKLRRTQPHSTIDAYTHGKSYDPRQGRVPDSEQSWKNTGPQGSGDMFPNLGPQTPANKRPIRLGWEKRYAQSLSPNLEDAGAMTAPNTPQRKKLRAGRASK